MPRPGMRPLNIGHRGHSDTLENTLMSFHQAIDMGAQMMELDVRLTKDGVPVVFHDYGLGRISKKSGSVGNRTSKHILNVELPGGHRIPSLHQVLEELLPRVPINLELKFRHLDYRPLVAKVCDTVKEFGAESKILVSSFHHGSLKIVRRLAPGIATAPLFGWSTGLPHQDDLEELAALPAVKNDLNFHRPAAVLYYAQIDESLTQAFLDHDLTLLTYTVDELPEMERLTKLGVDGIITNRPGRLHSYLAETF